MNTLLHQRRHRMLQLLAIGNSLQSTITSISQEYHCSQNTIYKDYQNMDKWGKKFRHDKQLEFLLYARLELLNRTATDTMLSAKKSPDKVRAANLVLKITQEQKKIEPQAEAQKGGLQGIGPMKIPFEYDPLIKQAYLDEQKKQLASAAARAEVDGSAKAEVNEGD